LHNCFRRRNLEFFGLIGLGVRSKLFESLCSAKGRFSQKRQILNRRNELCNGLILFVIILNSFGFSCDQSKQDEQNVHVQIILTDQNSPSKDRVIEELLTLQRSLIIPIQHPIPNQYIQDGFLFIPMNPEYLNNLLEQKDGCIVGAYLEEILVGYILLTDISEFKELYREASIGSIETTMDMQKLESLLMPSSIGYIEQIGVTTSHSRKGIGSLLINTCKKLKPGGLVADVFIDPMKNEASLHFFSHKGFQEFGILYQNPRADFPYAHRTQVFFWNLMPPTELHSFVKIP